MRKYCKKIILIFCMLFAIFTINKCYAISSKEDVEYFIEYRNSELEKQIKKEGYEYGNWYADGTVRLLPDKSEVILDNIVEEVFREYFDKYLTEEVSDEERLYDYIIDSNFVYTRKENYKDGDDIEAKFVLCVFPAFEDSNWSKDKDVQTLKTYDKNKDSMISIEGYFTDSYYIRLSKENDEYVIKFMDSLPEGFSEFVEKVKSEVGLDLENINYADFINAKSQTEIIAEAVEKEDLNSGQTINVEENEIKDRVSFTIIMVCGALAFIMVLRYFRYLKKTRNFTKNL